jgi:hypothetical protein
MIFASQLTFGFMMMPAKMCLKCFTQTAVLNVLCFQRIGLNFRMCLVANRHIHKIVFWYKGFDYLVTV